MKILICLLCLTAIGFAQPYEPTLLYDEFVHVGAALAPIGDQDGDGYDDILLSIWDELPAFYSHLRIMYGGEEPPYRCLDFAYANIDTSEDIYFWRMLFFSTCGDYNGDGHTDIMVELTNSNGGWSHMVLYLGGPELFDTLWDWRTEQARPYGCHGSVGDYDADGNADYCAGGLSSSQFYNHFPFYSGEYSTLSENPTWTYSPGDTIGGYLFGGYARFSHGFGDINGDGWGDFTFPYWEPTGPETGFPHYEFWLGGQGADSLPDVELVYHEWDESARGWTIIGDVNGDGFDDLLAGNYDDDPGIPDIYYGGNPLDLEESDAILNRPDWFFPFIPEDIASGIANLGDINNDGCEDIAFHCWAHPGGDTFMSFWEATLWIPMWISAFSTSMTEISIPAIMSTVRGTSMATGLTTGCFTVLNWLHSRVGSQ